MNQKCHQETLKNAETPQHLVYLCHMTKKWPYLGHVMKEERKKNLN